MEFFQLFKILHIIGGFIALFVFWIPIVTKKGGKAHRVSGWVYTSGMIVVAISAFYMGAYRIFFDQNANAELISFSWFLIFIAILSSAAAYYGIRVLRFNNRKDRHRNVLDLFYPLLLLSSGIGICIYGTVNDAPLLTWFPLVGIFLGISQLSYWLQKPKHKMHWWFEHFSGMLACCISTITAFMVFGAPRLLGIESVSILLWFLPTIVITPIIIGLSIYYRKKFKGLNNKAA
ncbi:DUF2306 domain-containing protein [Metabacillus idriensis]|uniref:DUF2306 domain-containing protein n=1 Tax=Metabacillus idriensis TaxID=324768 RepID=UPI001749FAB9|nr:DUF2306 domain-containing protein [Metabacillus idriensis]